MSIYRYTLSGYHAIKKADITIDGITVLAGENGCGKSTLSRWLYYLVNGAQQFEDLNIEWYERELNQMEKEQYPAVREMRYYVQKIDRPQKRIAFARPAHTYNSALSDREEKIRRIQERCEMYIYNTGELIAEYINSSKEDETRKRIIRFFGVDSYMEEDESSSLIAKRYIDHKLEWLRQKTEILDETLESRSIKFFFDSIRHKYQETDETPQHIQLQEDDVKMIREDRVSSLFNLRRAIYIDTPMALANEYTENTFWEELIDLIMQSRQKMDVSRKKLLRRIANILHGEAKIRKDDFNDDELRFVSDDGKVNIEIEKAATGFKTFIYLQRLLENGYLGSDCLLLIDEPEAHLHPQWIVEYARLLVLLHKELGQKIMLATHNPDMVAAIRSIAEREQVLDKTNFYISEPSGKSNTYCYKALGTDISEIFTSFNIALDRIQAYGTDNL